MDKSNIFFSHATIREQLTKDSYYRRKMKWPLIPMGEFSQFQCPNRKYSRDRDVDLLVVNESYYSECSSIDDYKENIIEKIYHYFPMARILLEKYIGHLAICGGIFSSILSNSIPNDADFFFYNCTEEKANEILADCVAILTSLRIHSKSFCNDPDTDFSNIRIERQSHITTVRFAYKYRFQRYDGTFYEQSETNETKYQFIHRIYPSLDTIIGGFDIGPCMVAFDGNDIYATPLGAFSIQNICMVVDTTRRSTSYNYRLIKYNNRGYKIIFPGLRFKDFDFFESSLADRISQVEHLMERLGLRFTGHSDYGGYDNQQLTNKISILNMDMNNLSIKTKYYGFEICNPNKNDLDKTLKHHSDYSYRNVITTLLKRANGGALRCSNLDAVIIYKVITSQMSYDNAMNEYMKLRDSPKVHSDINSFKDIISNLKYHWYRRESNYYNLFAEYSNRVFNSHIRSFQEDDVDGWLKTCNEISDTLLPRMAENIDKVETKLKGVTWMVKNPQRQWTSSINPIMEDPRMFYGEHYTEFKIGIPEAVETMLRLIYSRKTSTPGLSWLATDVFNLILELLFLNWEH